MIKSGIFPDSLKIAKIIPLYKKGDINSITNYRPVSLLLTLSMIFERVIFNQLLILIIQIFYLKNNMDFDQIILQSWQLLNVNSEYDNYFFREGLIILIFYE